MIAADRWDEIMRYLPVQKGDFVYLPAGVVHALKRGASFTKFSRQRISPIAFLIITG